MQLYNKLSAKERTTLIEEAGKDRLTISFYLNLLRNFSILIITSTSIISPRVIIITN